MSKRDNRRLKNRRFRRAVNNGLDVGDKISGRRIQRHGYGSGIGRGHNLTNSKRTRNHAESAKAQAHKWEALMERLSRQSS